MWDNMEVKVSGLAMNINEIKFTPSNQGRYIMAIVQEIRWSKWP
jgi:hypothetical protein